MSTKGANVRQVYSLNFLRQTHATWKDRFDSVKDTFHWVYPFKFLGNF